ncbi:MAG: LTA synthase family protein [Myxococcota bacterium]|nr:LTA synthase family protein [Myxococcota bacterium]
MANSLGAAGQGGAGVRWLAAYAALVLVPWCLRGLLLFETGAGFSVADLRGFLADAAVAAVAWAVLGFLAGWSRFLAVAGALLLAAVATANYETILALGAVASLGDAAYLGDATFLSGSAAALTHPVLVAFGMAGVAGLAWFGFGAARPPVAWGALAAGAVLLVGLAAWPPSGSIQAWRQVNPPLNELQWLVRGGPGSRDGPVSRDALAERLPSLRGDLDGAPRVALDGRRRNVLLVVVEGVSGAYLQTAARVHRRNPALQMDRLDAVFRDNVGFATFLNHNRRTNRGLYALLCGEMPALVRGMPKMTVASTRPWRDCLPEILRSHGYETVYLQAAPLAFMLKDQFMPRIGFERVLGHKWFERYYLRTTWGVDDRAFFEQASELIESLQAESKPWFLTLLTVGTHHPYVVPPPYRSPIARQNVRGAFEYLDLAIGEFMTWLEASGVRDDTLVIFTSDEASGHQVGSTDVFAQRLSQNWGFLAALLPDRSRLLVTEPYAQSDVPLTVLDYLGLGSEAGPLHGRSLFRRYDAGRHLFFGNVNLRTIGALDPSGLLVVCAFEGSECTGYDAFSGRVFGEAPQSAEVSPELASLVVDIADRSLPPRDTGDLEVPLLSDERFTVDMRDWQLVQGVAQVALEPDEWLEVDIEVEVSGEGRAEIEHYLRFPRKRMLLYGTSVVSPGQTLRIHYTLAAGDRITQMACRTKARLIDGWKLELLHTRRRFVVHRGGERPPPGLQVEVYETGGAPVDVTIMPPAAIDRIAREMSPAGPTDAGG